MPENIFDKNLKNPQTPVVPKEQKEINEINETEFLKKTRERNRKKLVKLNFLEKERVAQHIYDQYSEVKDDHSKLEEDIDNYDEVYRMLPKPITGSDGDTPDYRTTLSTVALETIHANIMNVFFTPKDTMRILPTEAGDIPKIEKLDIFGNWSMKNELNLFENCDRLFHASAKNGDNPYMIHWVKEYGTEIKIEPLMNPADIEQPLIDKDTGDVLTQEREIEKLLYNGPKMEVFTRKDYILPKNATRDKRPDWEIRRIRYTADEVNRKEKEGEFYPETFTNIGGWGSSAPLDNSQIDKDGETVPLGKTEKIFALFFGRMRVKSVKTNKDSNTAIDESKEFEELEDEFIGVIELNSQTLCSLKKNRFPLKMRPIGLDTFMPDDEGRANGIGVIEFMEGLQNLDDILLNQYIFGTTQSNSPFGFFTPMGNMRNEPIKTKAGFIYPTSDPNSVNIVKIPPPDNSLILAREDVKAQAQLLFGISAYTSGVESTIDPSAPAKKAEIVVAQGNVRLNLIVKRKNKTLTDIFKRWYLLYQANMPPNKFMRIAGEDHNNPWKFEKINITDFALKNIPDFELTGNVLNANKTLEVQKAIGIYNLLIANPFFNAATQPGMQALHALTKWLLDKLDETGISNFLPPSQGENVQTPEEENARFLQGDDGTPEEGEDHVEHIRKHREFLLTPNLPEEVIKMIVTHIQKTSEMLKEQITQQIVLAQGGKGAPGTVQESGNVLPGQPGLARPQGANQANIPQL